MPRSTVLCPLAAFSRIELAQYAVVTLPNTLVARAKIAESGDKLTDNSTQQKTPIMNSHNWLRHVANNKRQTKLHTNTRQKQYSNEDTLRAFKGKSNDNTQYTKLPKQQPNLDKWENRKRNANFVSTNT